VAKNTAQLKVARRDTPKSAIVPTGPVGQSHSILSSGDTRRAAAYQIADETLRSDAVPLAPAKQDYPAVASHGLDAANRTALGLLDQRISEGDDALIAVRNLLRHYIDIIVNLEPMAHIGCSPLRPDDRFIEAFSQILTLMHVQYQQIDDLQRLITDVV
jgi:hypothetical protein